MRTSTIIDGDLQGVFAVPPLARSANETRTLDLIQNDLIVHHIVGGGITRLIYGGNAFLYHITQMEYAQLLAWLADLPDEVWVIPSVGPDYGFALDQARLLRRHRFPGVMVLPCSDPRDAAGLESGYREIADAADARLIVYLKAEDNFGSNKEAGLDAVARLIDDGVCIGVKYAVVRDDPTQDKYLEALLARVDRRFVISGIGERPAIIHLRDWKLPGFTTGSGCVAPGLSQQLFETCAHQDYAAAAPLRAEFMPLEDLRDTWNPAKVLHAAIELAGIARTGAVPPYLSGLLPNQLNALEPIARALFERNSIAALSCTDEPS